VSTIHEVQHATTVQAPADVVYRIIAEVENWPVILGPTVHVERLESDGSSELLQIWATANDEVRTWTSRRTLDAAARRITFRQQQPKPPVESMGGAWLLAETAPGRTRVVLDHDFSAVGDEALSVAWIAKATDRNSTAELAAIKAVAERYEEQAGLTLSFADTVPIEGDVDAVYDFLYQAQEWPDRIPHVAALELTESTPGIQVMTMETRTPDGSVHTTKSVRVRLPGHRLVYKQIETPALMSAHTGEWVLRQQGGTVLATSRHTVAIRPDAVPAVLGPDATTADALRFVQNALSANSTTTLRHAAGYADPVRLRAAS
jgi:aromatase